MRAKSPTMPSFAPTQQPVVADLKSCEAWLARTALADPKIACRELTGLLESLEEVAPGERALVDILERLREPIVVAQAEHAKRYAGHPLPLKDYEISAFEQVIDLWSTLGRSYRRLLRSVVEDGSPELAGKEALLAQRALDCVGELMLVHYRSRRELDNELWHDLHQLYHTTEQRGVAMTTVSAGHRSKSVSTCAEVYVRALLLALANPYSLGSRELAWTRRWATMWAYKVDLVPAAPGMHGYAVDLAGNQPPTWSHGDAADAAMTRVLETANLRRSLRGRIKKLEVGVDPQTLGLGKDCVQPDVARLLNTLARAWVETPAPRQFTRRLVAARTELVSGFHSIHLALGGKMLKSAGRHWDYSRRDAEQLHIYQGAAAPAADEHPTGFAAERWETLDESANGFRLRRKGPGERLALAQLVALRPNGARGFILSEVRWLQSGIDQSLTIGAAALPGLARGVAVRPASSPNNAPEPYMQAFLLPNAANQPGSLVLPSGWYQRGRELEVRDDDESLRVQLAGLVQRGYDYDRANFSIVGSTPF